MLKTPQRTDATPLHIQLLFVQVPVPLALVRGRSSLGESLKAWVLVVGDLTEVVWVEKKLTQAKPVVTFTYLTIITTIFVFIVCILHEF